MQALRAAVIGAGASGLVTARYLIRAGFDVKILDRYGSPGGLWNTEEGSNPLYESLRTNLPKEVMYFRGFPFLPSTHGSFVTAKEVHNYLKRYAKLNSLESIIVHCDVEKVTPQDIKDRNTRWNIVYREFNKKRFKLNGL